MFQTTSLSDAIIWSLDHNLARQSSDDQLGFKRLQVLRNTTALRFITNAEAGGPHFTAQYQSFSQCPPLYEPRPGSDGGCQIGIWFFRCLWSAILWWLSLLIFVLFPPLSECSDNCASCVDYAHCLNCQPLYMLHQYHCVKPCPERYFATVSGSVAICSSCTVGCLHCSSASSCDTCDTAAGYYFLSGSSQCVRCPSHFHGSSQTGHCIENAIWKVSSSQFMIGLLATAIAAIATVIVLVLTCRMKKHSILYVVFSRLLAWLIITSFLPPGSRASSPLFLLLILVGLLLALAVPAIVFAAPVTALTCHLIPIVGGFAFALIFGWYTHLLIDFHALCPFVHFCAFLSLPVFFRRPGVFSKYFWMQN